MRVFILNDTSTHTHAGCKATMRSLERRFPRDIVVGRTYVKQADTPEDFNGADVVVLNGEGTMHHGRPQAAYQIEQLRRAQALGLRTVIVNTIWQENPDEWGGVFKAAVAAARDPWSAEQMSLHAGDHGIAVFPDLCLDELVRPNAPGPHQGRVVLGDVGASRAAPTWIALRKMVSRRATMARDSLQDLVDEIAGCSVYLTGQWHGVVAALAAGVRFAAMPSNSWKIEAMLAWSETGLTVRNHQQMLHAARGEQDGIGGSVEIFKEISKWYMTLPRVPIPLVT